MCLGSRRQEAASWVQPAATASEQEALGGRGAFHATKLFGSSSLLVNGKKRFRGLKIHNKTKLSEIKMVKITRCHKVRHKKV